MTNNKKYKLLLLTTFSFIITTTLFQNCSPVKLGIRNLGLLGPNFSEGLSYAPKSVSGSQVITNGNVVLKEYRHKSSNRFFYTSRTQDQALLDTTFATLFEVTGNTITLKAVQDAGFSPVYRLFNKAGFHLYTADQTEQAPLLTNSSWQDEGIEGYAITINPNTSCPITSAATRPVSRLLHAGNGKYRLVANDTLKAQLISNDYVDKGIVFCAVDASTVVVPVVVTPPICNAPSCANPPTGYTYSGSTIVNGCVTSCGNLIPIAPPSCGSLPAGYTASVCSGFYRNTGNAQVVNYCDCVGNGPPPPQNASCTLGTTTIAHGASVTAYQAASVTAPATCQSQTKACNNGVLTATTRTTDNFLYAACTVVPLVVGPPAPTACVAGRVDYARGPYSGVTFTGVPVTPINTFTGHVASFEFTPSGPRFAPYVLLAFIDQGAVSGKEFTVSECPGDFNPLTSQAIPYGELAEHTHGDVYLRLYTDAAAFAAAPLGPYVLAPPARRFYLNVRTKWCGGPGLVGGTCRPFYSFAGNG
ncbi:MAG: hypothetical protein H7328_11955 [Bdellovibrio sp.]|nr:hypothetical protein [Bdellovibrio sp.]